jgi:hypothetical protein
MVRRGAFLPFYIQSLLRLSNSVPSPSAATKQELAKTKRVTLLPASMMKDAGPLHRNPVSIL